METSETFVNEMKYIPDNYANNPIYSKDTMILG